MFKVIFDYNISFLKYSYCHHFPHSDTPPCRSQLLLLFVQMTFRLFFLKSSELSAYSCVPYFKLCVCCPSLYLFIPVCFKTILTLFILPYIICLLFSVPWPFILTIFTVTKFCYFIGFRKIMDVFSTLL